MHKFANNMSSMIAKENLYSLHMRYLDEEERSKCSTTQDHQQKAKKVEKSDDSESSD